ncbi:hypothetical protein WG66_011497, partial [Moniliophthora roreri]
IFISNNCHADRTLVYITNLIFASPIFLIRQFELTSLFQILHFINSPRSPNASSVGAEDRLLVHFYEGRTSLILRVLNTLIKESDEMNPRFLCLSCPDSRRRMLSGKAQPVWCLLSAELTSIISTSM